MIVDLIIPALNEERSIALVIQQIDRNRIREVVVVDNDSSDNTASAAERAGATVLSELNRGYGYACMKGIRHCSDKNSPPDVLLFMDGDLADDPSDLEHVITPIITSNADLVIGSRLSGLAEPGSLTIPQRFGNWLSAFLIRAFFGVRFTDLGPFRAVRLSRILEMKMSEMTYGWTVEMQLKAASMNMKCVEVPVRYRKRHSGVSKVSGTFSGTVLAGYRILLVVFRHALFRKDS